MDITLESIQAAASRLDGVTVRTPLLALNGTGNTEGIFIKPEVLQPIGSYKLRGVYNTLMLQHERSPLQAATTTSAGNMSQGVAWSASRIGIPATAIMPDDAPQFKIDATRGFGGDIEFVTRDELFAAMVDGRYDSRPGFVHPFRDVDLVAGHGTIGLEILEDMPDVETVIVPVGGGGLLAGIATAIKAINTNVNVLGVQPEACCAMAISLEAGKPMTMECSPTIVDGAGANFVGESTFPIILEHVSSCLTVSDVLVREAIFRLATKNKIVAEGAGALATAAALNIPFEERGKTVCLVSGGSIDPDLLADILING